MRSSSGPEGYTNTRYMHKKEWIQDDGLITCGRKEWRRERGRDGMSKWGKHGKGKNKCFLCESMNVCRLVWSVPWPMCLATMPSPYCESTRRFPLWFCGEGPKQWECRRLCWCRSLIDFIGVMAVGEIAWSVTVLNADYEMTMTIYFPVKLAYF